MRDWIIKVFILLIVFTLVYFFASAVFRFASKSYYINEKQLYKLDTFYLLNRAYESVTGGSRGGSNEQLTFESTNRYSFSIKGFVFKSIINKKQLEDTLMYHELAFIPYTNKKYFTKYKAASQPIYIKVYQIQIGNTKYIDINSINHYNKISLYLKVIILPLGLLILFIIIRIKSKKNKFSASIIV